MDLEDLQEVNRRLDEHVELQKLKQSPLYFALDDEEEQVLDFSDIEAKYQQDGASAAVPEQYRQYFITREGNGVILRLYPAGLTTDVAFSQDLIDHINQTIAAIGPERFHPSIECVYKGSFQNSANQFTIIIRDLKSTALYSIVGVLLAHHPVLPPSSWLALHHLATDDEPDLDFWRHLLGHRQSQHDHRGAVRHPLWAGH